MAKNKNKRSADANLADLAGAQAVMEFHKTTNPTINNPKGKPKDWDIAMYFRKTPTQPKAKKSTYYKGTKEDAEQEALLFRIAF